MKIIVKPIFLAPSGYWWAYSQLKPDRVYSLHTKDRLRAQADYDRQIANLRKYISSDDPAGDAGMQGVQERFRGKAE